MAVNCRIYRDFKRPETSLIESYRDVPVASIDDCMNRLAAVSSAIRPMGGKHRVVGAAFTVKVPAGDNLMLHKAMDLAMPGDVIVIDAGGSTERAILGSLMASYCMSRGIAGVLVDGAIRDCQELAEMDYPIYGIAATPNGPYKNGPGEINTPISFGGRIVCPGDIVVADDDGVVILTPCVAREILPQVQALVEKEKGIMSGIVRERTYIRPWVDEKLSSIGCEEFDCWKGWDD